MTVNGPREVISSEPNDTIFQANVSDMTRYMRFIGVYNIIIGGLYCIGIITAIVGVPIIIMGVRLREAADAFNRYSLSQTFQDLSHAVERQKRSLFILYVLLVIGLIIMAIYIIIMIGVLLSEA